MPYFPVFVDLKDKEVVVVGGGKVAERKIEKLLIFEPRIRVISPKITKGIRDLHNQGKIELTLRKVRLADIKRAFMVIVAVDDIKLQKRLYQYCKKKRHTLQLSG